ncbi:MAG: hypothetical protein E7422_00240 [Ruminococcaceae bacterium]|jgi:hypothetical protein|nr:hypothetical protein [Oscillospiraceae bacterium]
MRSIVAYTEEIDDLDEACEELFGQVRDFPLASNTMAILFTEEDTDYPALYERLSRRWDFPVMGCTAMAMLSGEQGYCRGGISVLLLTADDCRFSVGITDELDETRYQEQIRRLYQELEAQHDSPVKLGVCYYGFPVDSHELSGSGLLAVLRQAAGEMPIYGGTASDNLTFTGYRVFCNDREIKNALALALISGNVKPRFVRVNSVEHTAAFSYEITKAHENVVYRLGKQSFVETLREENMRVDQKNMMTAYILSPFVVTVDKGSGDKVKVARVLSTLDLETGSGTFLGVMPEGAVLSIGLINRDDVCRSVEKAFAEILRELSREKNECSTLLVTSCAARFLALMNDPAAEAQAYLGRLPEGVSLMGLYALGECCPVRGEKTGKEYNMFHNFTFTILAL